MSSEMTAAQVETAGVDLMGDSSVKPALQATALLASHATNLAWENLDGVVVDRTINHILDALACSLVGTKLPWISQVRAYACDTGRHGEASVVGGGMLVPEWAAFVNATSAHGFELDDYHSGALSHPGCVVVPTVLAVAEQFGSKGREAIVACALGMEAIVRIGLASSPSMVVDRGFHETCAQGVFGAALSAGKLLGLDEAGMVSALGIAGSHASGTRQYAHGGGEVKRLHAGLGAMGGIRSVMLTKRGLRGPSQILEGDKGFLRAFANEYSPQLITENLGEEWHFMQCGIKPYASCGVIHSSIDALLELLNEHSLSCGDVAEIHAGVDRLTIEHCGSLPIPPNDMNGAQFNLPYALGMAMVLKGNGFSDYWRLQETGFDVPDIVDAARKVRMSIDDEVNRAFPRTLMSRIRVRTKQGAWLEKVAKPRGSKDRPFTRAEIGRKFTDLLTTTPWAGRTRQIEEAVEALRDDAPVSDLTELLRVGERP